MVVVDVVVDIDVATVDDIEVAVPTTVWSNTVVERIVAVKVLVLDGTAVVAVEGSLVIFVAVTILTVPTVLVERGPR